MDKSIVRNAMIVSNSERTRFNLIIIITMILVTATVICFTLLTSASEETILHGDKYYSSVQIQESDTLWGLALEYNTDASISTQDYINLIKQVNGLQSDTIYAGQHIIIMFTY